MDIELTHENATHLLLCAHQIGSMRKEYNMRCHVIRALPNDRLRVLVFGERNWKGKEHVCRVRSVESWRVAERKV